MIHRPNPSAFALSTTLLLLTTGCQPGPIWDGSDETERSSTCRPSPWEWSQIHCKTEYGPCFGNIEGYEDGWTYVAPNPEVIENWDPVAPETAWGCLPTDYGCWDDIVCAQRPGTEYAGCWAELDGELVPVVPTCALPEATSTPWPSTRCGGAVPELGPHPWEEIFCVDPDFGACYGRRGDLWAAVEPTCFLTT